MRNLGIIQIEPLLIIELLSIPEHLLRDGHRGIEYNFNRDVFQVKLSHPSFMSVNDGEEIPLYNEFHTNGYCESCQRRKILYFGLSP